MGNKEKGMTTRNAKVKCNISLCRSGIFVRGHRRMIDSLRFLMQNHVYRLGLSPLIFLRDDKCARDPSIIDLTLRCAGLSFKIKNITSPAMTNVTRTTCVRVENNIKLSNIAMKVFEECPECSKNVLCIAFFSVILM